MTTERLLLVYTDDMAIDNGSNLLDHVSSRKTNANYLQCSFKLIFYESNRCICYLNLLRC